jgi:uncharacterized protein YqkB
MTKTKTNIKVSGKVFEKLVARLKRQNKAFWKLSVKKQRIAIAKDVLALLKAKLIKPQSTYLRIPEQAAEKIYDADADLVREIDAGVLIEQVSCEVCGIGSLFLAAVHKNNKLTIEDLLNINIEDRLIIDGAADRCRDDQMEYLKKWFGPQQLDLIEFYFEDDDHCHEKFGPILNTDWMTEKDERLIMIMENIISNNGVFYPRKGKHSAKHAPLSTSKEGW